MNHYYLYNLLAETPDLPVANHWFRDGDPGNLVLAAGAGIVSSTQKAAAPRSASSTSCSRSGRSASSHAARARPSIRSSTAFRAGPGCERCRRSRGRSTILGRLSADLDTGRADAPRGGLRQVSGAGAAAAVSSPGRRAPRLLVTLAGLVALGALLPIAYLALRALSADAAARALAPASTTLELAWDTALLAFGVVVATLVVGVPLAWLVVRTDLPARRLWGIAASLPLVIPSFVAALALLGAFAPRGLAQEALEPLGVERLPEVTGYWGALVALTLSTYPYVYLLAAAGLRTPTPRPKRLREASARAASRVFTRVTLPALRPSLAAALAPRRALRSLGLRRRVAHGLLHAHDRHLRALRVAPRARIGGDPRARSARPGPGNRARGIALPAPGSDPPQHAGRRAIGRGRPARPVAVASARVLHGRDRPVPRRSGRRPHLVGGHRGPDHRPRGRRLVGRARLGDDGDGDRSRCGDRRTPRGACSRGAIRPGRRGGSSA